MSQLSRPCRTEALLQHTHMADNNTPLPCVRRPARCPDPAVTAHYTRLLRHLAVEVNASREKASRFARAATVASATAPTAAVPTCPGTAYEEAAWLNRAVLDMDALHDGETDCQAEDGEEGAVANAHVPPGAEFAQRFLQKAWTRWSSMTASTTSTASSSGNKSERYSGHTGTTPITPSALCVVVLQDADFDFLSDDAVGISSCPSLGVLPTESRGAPRGYPSNTRSCGLMSNTAVTARQTPACVSDAASRTVSVMVVSSGFVIHSLFFQSWCNPLDFLYLGTPASMRDAQGATCSGTPPSRILSLRIPWSSKASSSSSESTALLVDVTYAVPAGAARDTQSSPPIISEQDPETSPDAIRDVVGNVLRHHLTVGDPFVIQERLTDDPREVGDPVERAQLRAALLISPSPLFEPPARSSVSPSSRKRDRSWQLEERDTDSDEETPQKDVDVGVGAADSVSNKLTDLFVDEDASSLPTAHHVGTLSRRSLLPTPLRRAVCVSDADLARVLADADARDKGRTAPGTSVADDACSGGDGVRMMNTEEMRSDDDDDEVDADETWCWWTAAALAALRLRVDWQRVRRQGWQQVRNGTAATEAQARAIEKVKVLMDCQHICDAVRRHRTLSSMVPSSADCVAPRPPGESVWELTARDLSRLVEQDPNEDAALRTSPDALVSRMLERVRASLMRLPEKAPARALLLEVMTHMPDAGAASLFEERVWQRAVLHVPRLPLTQIAAPTPESTASCAHADSAAAVTDPVTELSDWVLASATLPSVRHRDGYGERTPTADTTATRRVDDPREAVLALLPPGRVVQFFRDALDSFLSTSQLPVTIAEQVTRAASQPHTSPAYPVPLPAAISVSTLTPKPTLTTREIQRQLVWLVVQAHKQEVMHVLHLFSSHCEATSAESSAAAGTPLTDTPVSVTDDAPMTVLHQFWEKVASEVTALIEASPGNDNDYVWPPLHTPTDERAEESPGAHDHSKMVRPMKDVVSACHPSGSLSGFEAMCLYLEGSPTFASTSEQSAPQNNDATHATAEDGCITDTQPFRVSAYPWLQHLLFLLAHGDSDPLQYVSPRDYIASTFDSLPDDAQSTDEQTSSFDDTYALELFRYERLAACQVAAEAHADALDCALSTAYSAYSIRWRKASQWLDAAFASQ